MRVSSKKAVYSITIIEMLLFISIYGIRVLNPCYTDWLLVNGGDLEQHYIGWLAYKKSVWMFPIGLTNNLCNPYDTSIIFTDSIPLLAVPCKLLGMFIQMDFQYFGIWALLCFELQGIIAFKIYSKYVDSEIYCVLAAILTTLAPVMLLRVFVHTALAAQWLILLAIYYLLEYDVDNKRNILRVVILSVLATMTHIYFVLMVGIIVMGICIKDITLSKRIKGSLIFLIVYILPAMIIVYLLGGFSVGTASNAGGYGYYNLNLNAFFNPDALSGWESDWSYFLDGLPRTDFRQYEGFAYLGIGCMFLLGVALMVFVKKHLRIIKKEDFIAIIAIFMVSLVYAIGPNVDLGDKEILSVSVPEGLMNILSIFRASGRVVWISVYLLVVLAVVCVGKLQYKNIAITIISSALCIQIGDLHPKLMEKWNTFSVQSRYENSLEQCNILREALSDKSIKHLVLMDDLEQSENFDFAILALKNNKTINTFYLAREMDSQIDAYRKLVKEEWLMDAIYIYYADTQISIPSNFREYDFEQYKIVMKK